MSIEHESAACERPEVLATKHVLHTEAGARWEHPGYRTLQCIFCQHWFIMGRDVSTVDCGYQDNRHPVFEYRGAYD